MASPESGPSSGLPLWIQQSNLSDEHISSPRPILRRASRASAHSDDDLVHAHSPTSYTHSPLSNAQARSYDDEDARERQRTMDVESAMLLSRARSGTITKSPHTHPGSPHADIFEPQMLSRREEDEMLLARGGYDATAPSTANTYDGGEPAVGRITTDDSVLADDSPDILDSLAASAQPAHDHGNAQPPLYAHPAHRDNFDFATMEAFAEEERIKLGIHTAPSGLDDLRRRLQQQKLRTPPPQATAAEKPDSEAQKSAPAMGMGDGTETPRSRARHRKLSQSHPKPRVRSGKLAIFEGDLGAPSPNGGMRSTSAGGGVNGPSVTFEDTPRPQGHRQESGHERPFRFSFYSNALSSTIHSRSVCELPADSQSFEHLFTGAGESGSAGHSHQAPPVKSDAAPANSEASLNNSKAPSRTHLALKDEEISTWWLDVLHPTDDEMRMFSKVFSIHPLTTEDILMEETREKIELFRHYYLVCFRGFDQDPYSPTYLEPVNMYIIVFREGILSFHFHPTPHPLNVRRRIKQLKDYISVTSDWISYALIDDITDAFGPLILSIEYEVDNIDEHVLILKDQEQTDMLRRIGTCRKKVMGLLRLMGSKADVVKGLAKRCNENWSVAPKSDIGLYLSDIQDHLITMTQNLNHYEKILSRSHSNYLAQISIEMTDANNKINDVLSKLTALGTVLIPMNLITGLWGMNVHVPGQNIQEGYTWFLSIVGCLIGLAICGAVITYRLMTSR